MPIEKRPDTPIKKPKLAELAPEEGVPKIIAPPANAESSADSGMVSNIDLENQVSDYEEFVNEVM